MKTTKKSSVKEFKNQAVNSVVYNWHNEVIPVRGMNALISRKGSLSTKGPNGCERSCRCIMRKAYANYRKPKA